MNAHKSNVKLNCKKTQQTLQLLLDPSFAALSLVSICQSLLLHRTAVSPS